MDASDTDRYVAGRAALRRTTLAMQPRVRRRRLLELAFQGYSLGYSLAAIAHLTALTVPEIGRILKACKAILRRGGVL